MDNRVNDIRRIIRALRVTMCEAEAIMHDQIAREADCSFVAGEIIKMRRVMSQLVRERLALGDSEPIVVNSIVVRLPCPVGRAASSGMAARPVR
jgi:hypothetical protein